MIAHLPMYDVSKNYQAHQRLWQAFRDLMPNAPSLTRHSDNLLSDWLNPELFFFQTCGLPFRASLRRHVKLIATPNNNIENCAPGFYHSVILARKGSAPDLIKMTLFSHIMSLNLNQAGLPRSLLGLVENPNFAPEDTQHRH